MITQRTRGFHNTLLICRALIATILMAICAGFTFTFLTSASLLQYARYPVYAAVVVAGLVLESVRGQRGLGPGELGKRNFLTQHGSALRQLAHAAGALLIYLTLLKDQFISRSFLLVYLPGLYLALLAANSYLPRLLARRIFRGVHEERILLIGPAAKARGLKAWIQSKELFGLQNVGILSDDAAPGTAIHGFAWLGRPDEAESVIQRERVTQVILLELPNQLPRHKNLVSVVEKFGVRFLILSNLEDLLEHPVVHLEDDGFRFITLREEPLENPLNRLLKRALDLAVALPVVLFVLPPLAVLIWIVQRFQSPGPLIYRQTRAGIQNRQFQIIKFRTMHVDGTDDARQATRGDARVYPAGRWLRRLSIDELPQFLNVLQGEMSVTGPRPHLVEHNAQFAERMANYHVRTFVKPGITGLAQVRGFRGEAHTAQQINQRLASDLSYLENWRLALDLAIIARTAWQMIRPPHTAY